MSLLLGVLPIASLHTVLTIPVMGARLCAGFPSPADDYVEGGLDPSALIVTNPAATFIWRVSGISMVRAGVNDGEYVVVDRSLVPKAGTWSFRSSAACRAPNRSYASRAAGWRWTSPTPP